MKRSFIFLKTLFVLLITNTFVSYSQVLNLEDTVICFSWNNVSNAWDSTFKNIYEYNGVGKMIRYIQQQYASPNWENSQKSEFQYDSNNNQIQDEFFNWNMSTSVWDPMFKIYRIYNSNNKLIHEYYLNWNGTQYDSTNWSTYTYDSNGYVQSFFSKLWLSGNWENSFGYVNTNDPNGNVLISVNLNWNGTQWDSTFKFIKTYNSSNNPLVQISQYYDNISNVWQNQSKTEKNYDANENLILENYFAWNGTSWDSTSRVIRTYNSSNNIVDQIHQYFQGGVWNNNQKTEYQYDSNNNNILYKQYIWQSGNWVPNYQDSSIYNSNDLLVEKIWGNFPMGNYEHSSRCIYNYKTINLSSIKNEVLVNKISCLISNPYSGQPVYCDLKSGNTYILTLTDLQGRIISQKEIYANNNIYLEQPFESGMYIINISNKEGTEFLTKKIFFMNY